VRLAALTSGPRFAAGLTSFLNRLRCCVAKIKNIRQKRPPKKFRIPNSVIQWGIIGVVGAVLVVLVVSALTRPSEPAPLPLLSTARNDLISLTRMLGDVVPDSSTRALFPSSLSARLAGPDSLFAQRRWYDALAALNRMLKGVSRPESAALYAYMGFCDYEAGNMDRALGSFRKSLVKDSSPNGLAPRIQFSIGWLFQSRGYQDSAIAHYARARSILADSAYLLSAEAANNAGVAYEVLKDSTSAKAAFNEAAAMLDTIAYSREAKAVRENLARLTGRK
jgi:tetratricopeptide (TPR) repeat protein